MNILTIISTLANAADNQRYSEATRKRLADLLARLIVEFEADVRAALKVPPPC